MFEQIQNTMNTTQQNTTESAGYQAPSYPMYNQNYYDQNQYYNTAVKQNDYNKSQPMNYYPYYTNVDNSWTNIPHNYNYYQNELATQMPYQTPTAYTNSVSPPPVQITYQPKINSELTPEKIMNDSGIDIISPQLSANLSKDSSFLNNLKLQQNDNYSNTISTNQNSVSFNQDLKAQDSKIEQFSSYKPTEEHNENSSEFSEDEDDEEEVEETSNKENTKTSKGNPKKPPKPYLEIIADSILTSEVKMMQLHEIYHLMEKKYLYFAKNINKSWRNSVRHNLSLNECFVKAGRGSNGKGNYWKIHPLCEKEFIRGNFRRKSFKQLIRAGSSNSVQPAVQRHIPYPVSIDYALNYTQNASQQFNQANNFQYNFFNTFQQQHAASIGKNNFEQNNSYNSQF